MSEKDDGGRAFPFAYETSHPEEHGINGGMALRDYFAAKAMQAALMKAQHNWAYDGLEFAIDWSHIAESAYDAADAMLKERAK